MSTYGNKSSYIIYIWAVETFKKQSKELALAQGSLGLRSFIETMTASTGRRTPGQSDVVNRDNRCGHRIFDVFWCRITICWTLLTSGKLTFCHGKSLVLMGKSTISMAIFNSFLYVYQRVLSRMSLSDAFLTLPKSSGSPGHSRT